MKDEESLINDLDSRFGKSTSALGKTSKKLQEIMYSSSGNVLLMTIVFALLIFVLLIKLT